MEKRVKKNIEFSTGEPSVSNLNVQFSTGEPSVSKCSESGSKYDPAHRWRG